MAIVETITPEPEPTETPITDRTRLILTAINRLDDKLVQLQDVGQAVREIQKQLGVNNTWRSAIIRALNQFLSHVDPNWKKNHQ
jgi:hypothetical protein